MLVGKWNESLAAVDKLTNAREVLWQKTHQCDSTYYNFNDFTFNLNFLNR